MKFNRIDRQKVIIRYPRLITKNEIVDSVYLLKMLDGSYYINVDGYFIKQSDKELLVRRQFKASRYQPRIDHLYTIDELFPQIYEGWNFGSEHNPARLICKRKNPRLNLKLVRFERKYG